MPPTPTTQDNSRLILLCVTAAICAILLASRPPSFDASLGAAQAQAPEEISPSSNLVTSDLMDRLPAYIASRWRLDEARAHRVVQLAAVAAPKLALDPLLVLAVIAKESGFRYVGNPGDYSIRPAAVDPLRPHGLMQVSGRWHAEKMPQDAVGNVRVTTSSENIEVGVRVLSDYLARERGDVLRALQRYNGNLADAEARYARHVLRMREELRTVAIGDA